MPNPFHASCGVDPLLIVGRDGVLEDFVEALDDGPGASGRAPLYRGARRWQDRDAQRGRGPRERARLAGH